MEEKIVLGVINMPQVSTILPVFNGEKFLKQAIDSVLAQDFKDWELIVINDGSSDASEVIVKDFQQADGRIRLVSNRENLGLVASLNRCLDMAGGEFIARLDSDDIWSLPDKLSRQVDFLRRNAGYGLVGTWAQVTDLNRRRLYDFKPPTRDLSIRRQMLMRNCFIHSSILARKKILLTAGGFKLEDKHVEDYALWLRMGQVSELANLPILALIYRQNPKGVTAEKNREQILQALRLVELHKTKYPNAFLAKIKWLAQKQFNCRALRKFFHRLF